MDQFHCAVKAGTRAAQKELKGKMVSVTSLLMWTESFLGLTFLSSVCLDGAGCSGGLKLMF